MDAAKTAQLELPEINYDFGQDVYWIKPPDQPHFNDCHGMALTKADALQYIHAVVGISNDPIRGKRYTPAEELLQEIRMRRAVSSRKILLRYNH